MEELERKKKHRLIGVADISCDVEGSVEFLKKTTTIDNPLFLYDVKNRKVHDE
jgi:alpha-aminoadipic semialdehyde synthase